MRNTYTFIAVVFNILLFSSLSAQVKSNVWLGGINEFPGQPNFGNYVLKFVDGNINVISKDLKMNFESTMAVGVDSLGEILFYTNGCHIATADGDTMPNGAGLNPGDMADWTCPDAGYASQKGALALPLPGSSSAFYLFHLGISYETEKRLTYGPFYYSVIDMALNGGKGAVISKNNVLISNNNLEPFSAVRHGNGRDWWLVLPQYGTNKYHKILFSPAGIASVGDQIIGDSLACRYIGSTAFSLQGNRFGRYQNCKLEVLDFDRCAGVFSNPLLLPLPKHTFGGGGIAFSSDGNKVIATTQSAILEADLTAATPQLDTIVKSPVLYGISLGSMQYDPRGKLLISNMGRERYYHIIDNPDGNVDNFGINVKGAELGKFSVRTLPNFPNFGLYNLSNSICDSLGISSLTEKVNQGNMRVYPNPATNNLHIETTHISEGRITVYNSLGAIMLEQEDSFAQTLTIPVQGWPTGNYFLCIRTNKGTVHFSRVILL